MAPTQHLRALQALELAIRHGSMQSAAEDLAITPAAVGQRIRSLEDYLGTDLLLRGRSGLRPTPAVEHALPDLQSAFAALENSTDKLDFQRVSEIHIVADPDWAELWLLPRLPAFRKAHPNILFCLNGEGDVPVRLGAPDVRVQRSPDEDGTSLFHDVYVPLCGPGNIHRIGDWDKALELEGLPLLHVEDSPADKDAVGWRQWVSRYGLRKEGIERGVHYRHMRLALDAARHDVGFLIGGLALARADIDSGALMPPYSLDQNLPAANPYRMILRDERRASPQQRKFCEWLEAEARETRLWLDASISGA
jgi:LysR family transcriptional regulator, glycine cleavage system transcriptional activator